MAIFGMNLLVLMVLNILIYGSSLAGWAALVFIFDSEGHKLFPLPVNVQHGPAKHMG